MSALKHFSMSDFHRDERGTIAIIFALTLLPLLGFVGLAVDYSRAAAVRTRMQNAADSTALKLVKDGGKLSDAALQTLGERFFKGALDTSDMVGAATVKVTRSNQTIKVAVAGAMDTAFMKLLGQNTVQVGTASEGKYDIRKLEIALVLDNTGSMAWSNKMPALKTAATNLLNSLEATAAASGPDSIKVAIVPFDTQVRLDAGLRYSPWLSFSQPDSPASKPAWQGYVEDRRFDSAQLTDAAKSYDANIAPADGFNADTLYPAVKNSPLYARGMLTPIRPLTTNFNDLRQTVADMKPRGCTNITLGATWGLTALMPGGPLNNTASAFKTANVDKIMVLLTDGNNTDSRQIHNPYFPYDCPEGTSAAPKIDQRTGLSCDTVKSYGVKVYTVRVIDGNQSLLKSCAGNGGVYQEVKDAAELQKVFDTIRDSILSVRLSG
jgi:Flp pilus assembly protein TadG